MSFKRYGDLPPEPQREVLDVAPEFISTPTWEASATDPDLLTRQLPDGWVWETPEWGDLATAHVWPAGALLSDGGKIWRNITTVPLTTPPSGFPGAPSEWGHLFVEVETGAEPEPEPEPGILAWAIGQTVASGDKRTHDGRLWLAKLAHITHIGWAPSASTYAVWADIGPA